MKRAGDGSSLWQGTARDASYNEGLPESSSDHISAVTQIKYSTGNNTASRHEINTCFSENMN